jgi:rhodanese/phosphatase family protein
MGLFSRGDDELPRPLANSYWVIPHRILAGEYPGGVDDADARARIELLSEAGIDAFFDLTEEGELPPYRHLLPRRSEYLRSSIADTWVPNNVAQTLELLAAMRAALHRRRRIYVHCRAGIGRTGLVVGCFLADQESDGNAALKRLNDLWRQSERAKQWPRVPQTAEQAEYILHWPTLAKATAARESAPSKPPAAGRSTPPRPAAHAAHAAPAARSSRAAPAARSSGTAPATPAASARDGSLFRSVGRANSTGRPGSDSPPSAGGRHSKKRR